MKKVLLVIFFFVIVLILLLIRDFYVTLHARNSLDNVQITLNKSEVVINNINYINVKCQIKGDLPEESNKLILFADNRFLEIIPSKIVLSEGITYIDLRAGGTEAVFSLESNPNKEINVFYQKKDNNVSPLIYTFIEEDINTCILKDKYISTKIFNVK